MAMNLSRLPEYTLKVLVAAGFDVEAACNSS